MNNKYYVSWNEVKDYIENLSIKLEKEFDLSMCPGIFTFPRGGLILATLLSYKIKLPILMNPANNCIIIDDIVDTGITMKKYSDLKKDKNYFITSMYIHESQINKEAEYNCDIDFYRYIKHDDWLVYPWEDISKW